jgi:hypothetical protein
MEAIKYQLLITPQEEQRARLIRPELYEGAGDFTGLDELENAMNELRDILLDPEVTGIEREEVQKELSVTHSRIMRTVWAIRILQA